jgi:hypothetical protein
VLRPPPTPSPALALTAPKLSDRARRNNGFARTLSNPIGSGTWQLAGAGAEAGSAQGVGHRAGRLAGPGALVAPSGTAAPTSASAVTAAAGPAAPVVATPAAGLAFAPTGVTRSPATTTPLGARLVVEP